MILLLSMLLMNHRRTGCCVLREARWCESKWSLVINGAHVRNDGIVIVKIEGARKSIRGGDCTYKRSRSGEGTWECWLRRRRACSLRHTSTKDE